MEEKEQIKVNLSTVIVTIIIICLIGLLGYFAYKNVELKDEKNEKTNELQILKDEVDELRNMINEAKYTEQNSIINQNTQVTDSIAKENTTNTNKNTTTFKTENAKETAIKELKKYLTDQNWIKNNIRITVDCFKKDIPTTDKQEYTFSVVNSNSDQPTVVVQAHSEKYLSVQIFLVTYKNNKINVKKLTNYGMHDSHNKYNASDNYIAQEYAHMGSWEYTIYEIKGLELKQLKSDEGQLKSDESDYKELENIEKQYNLKEISIELNSTNLDKYLK